MSDYLASADYADFRVGHETTLAGEHAWWRNIIQADLDRIHTAVAAHRATYQRLGYSTDLETSADGTSIDLRVRHKHPDKVTTADLEILKGSIAATVIVAGWGGGR